MSLRVNICDAFFQQMYLESSLEDVFAGVADTVFCGDSAYIYIRSVEELEHFGQWLSCIVHCFKSGVLFGGFVASFVKGQFFTGIWCKVLMDFASSGSGYAMWRPDSSLLLERRVVYRVMVADEEDREGVKDFVVFTSLSLGSGVNIS